MAQPPDGHPPLPGEPGEPDEPTPPTEAPTIAWTPPDDAAATPDPDAVAEPLTPSDAPPPPSTPQDQASQNPLISWAPSGGTAPPAEAPGAPVQGWVPPDAGAPGGPSVAAGWTVPTDARQAAPIAGYVVAGIPSRVVAFMVDSVLLVIVSVIVALIADPTLFDLRTTTPSSPSLLALLIVIAFDYAYFVWFWTGRGRATLGMRLVRIQLSDAAGDRPMRVVPASARWLLLTGAFSLLVVLPVAQGIFTLGVFIWYIVLLASVAANPLRQGIHDQAAGSLVVQRVGVSSNAAVVGCLLAVVMVVLVFIVLPILLVLAMGPEFEQYMREVQRTT
jgi:uncharacterized RDD family membrane protein YckC